jgi:hypothetical protein
MAVQVNPWGFLAGSYGANFEMLLGSSHGVLAEGNFAMSDTQTSLGGGLHYRFHPGGELATFFVGPFAKFFSSSGAVTETVGATTTEYDFTATALVFGLNIGRRWIWDPGLSLVLRGGYGYTLLNTSYPGAAPGSEDLVNLLLRFALGFDLELSVGWAF